MKECPLNLQGQPRQWRSQRYGHGSFECALWTKEPNSVRRDPQGKSRPWRPRDNRHPISPGSSGSAVGRWAKPGPRVRPHGAAREPSWSVRWIQWIGPHWRCLDFTESARMPRTASMSSRTNGAGVDTPPTSWALVDRWQTGSLSFTTGEISTFAQGCSSRLATSLR